MRVHPRGESSPWYSFKSQVVAAFGLALTQKTMFDRYLINTWPDGQSCVFLCLSIIMVLNLNMTVLGNVTIMHGNVPIIPGVIPTLIWDNTDEKGWNAMEKDDLLQLIFI